MKARLAVAALPIVALALMLVIVLTPSSGADHDAGADGTFLTALSIPETTTTPAPTTTTTAAPAPPAPTTTVAPAPTTTAAPVPTTTTAPPRPLAPPCSTFASQEEADAWMAANAGSHDTSNIDTNGDGVACTLSFAPPPAPTAAPSVTSGGGSGCVIPDYICARESGHSYTALNSSSGAGGMYQFMPSTWNAIARQIAPEWVGTPPHLAPPAVQDQFAAYLWAGGAGAGHWACC